MSPRRPTCSGHRGPAPIAGNRRPSLAAGNRHGFPAAGSKHGAPAAGARRYAPYAGPRLWRGPDAVRRDSNDPVAAKRGWGSPVAA